MFTFRAISSVWVTSALTQPNAYDLIGTVPPYSGGFSGDISTDPVGLYPTTNGNKKVGLKTPAEVLIDIGAASKSTNVSASIGTEWVGDSAPYSQTILVEGVNDTNMVEVLIVKNATTEQERAYNALRLKDGGQADGSLTLIAKGTKNTINIPITVIVRGDL